MACTALAFATSAFSAESQDAPSETLSESEARENGAPTDSTVDDFQRFTALPVLAYSEETELQFGGMMLLFFKPSFAGGETTTIDLALFGTTRKQLQIFAVPRYFLLHDRVKGMMDLSVERWTSVFYGIGNNPDFDDGWSFDRNSYYFTNTTLTNLGLPDTWRTLMYGLSLHVEHTEITFNKYEGDLQKPSTDGRLRTGFGYTLEYDTRDNPNWANSGYYAHWEHMFYTDAIGDYEFVKQELDLRGYTYLFWKTSLAVAGLWQRTAGDVPFDKMAGPDGRRRFRGVEDRFFRNNQALILQTELRKVLFWRLAGTIFFEGGKTGKYFSDLAREKWHQSLGFGGELALNLSERLYARGDISWVDYKDIGITVYIRQAF